MNKDNEELMKGLKDSAEGKVSERESFAKYIDEEDTQNQETDELSDKEESEEEKAKKHGHLSYEEHIAKGGRPEDYKTEKEFNLTGEVIGLKKALQKRDKDIEEILKYQQRVIEQHKIKMRQELENRLHQAKQNGDIDQVERLVQEKASMDQINQMDQQQLQARKFQEVEQDFISRNSSWHNQQHPELLQRAKDISILINRQYPNIAYDQLLGELERQMKFELSRDDRYAHLVSDTSVTSRPSLSTTKSAVTRSSTTSSEPEEVYYNKLNSNQKTRYAVLNRIAKKATGKSVSIKQFLADEANDSEL